MARFSVLMDFALPADYVPVHLPAGGVYLAGNVISGLTGAEAAELLQIAPEGTFAAADAEAESITGWLERKRAADHEINVGGSVGVSGETEAE